MLVVHVEVFVKSEFVEQFRTATLENARASLNEPGVARFDVIQREDDPRRFLLVEVYKTDEAPALHKETAHYAKWRDTVAEMMAEPRKSTKFRPLFPGASQWDTPSEK
jgi:autoinducer 2-degrading protein